jgi:hypothetical protein
MIMTVAHVKFLRFVFPVLTIIAFIILQNRNQNISVQWKCHIYEHVLSFYQTHQFISAILTNEFLILVTCLHDYVKAKHMLNQNSIYLREAAQEKQHDVGFIILLLCCVNGWLDTCMFTQHNCRVISSYHFILEIGTVRISSTAVKLRNLVMSTFCV